MCALISDKLYQNLRVVTRVLGITQGTSTCKSHTCLLCLLQSFLLGGGMREQWTFIRVHPGVGTCQCFASIFLFIDIPVYTFALFAPMSLTRVFLSFVCASDLLLYIGLLRVPGHDS